MKLIELILFSISAFILYLSSNVNAYGCEVDQASSDEDLQIACNDVTELPSFLNSELCKEVRGEK